MMANKIEFTCEEKHKFYPKPTPISEAIPDWWRDMPRDSAGVSQFVNVKNHTVKACIPFLDTLRTGYTIPMWCDLAVGLDPDDNAMIEWRPTEANQQIVQERMWDGFTNPQTGTGMPGTEEVEKPNSFLLINPWQIKTPEGYICLFMPVLNANLPLQFSAGIVNTDSYHNMVNFPFFVKQKWRGMVKKGTPLIQVIPFKRDEWEHDVRVMTEQDKDDWLKVKSDIENQFNSGYLENHGCPVRHT